MLTTIFEIKIRIPLFGYEPSNDKSFEWFFLDIFMFICMICEAILVLLDLILFPIELILYLIYILVKRKW